MKYIYITSARRNPTQNIKIDRNSEITKYYELDKKSGEKPSYFVSFTNLPKIGINPSNEYNTPIGIYTYPLRDMYEYIIQDKLPFAGDRPYIQILRLKSNKVLWGDTYSKSNYEKDAKKLEKIWHKDRYDVTLDNLHFAQNQLSGYINDSEDLEFFLCGNDDQYYNEDEEEYTSPEESLDNLNFYDLKKVAQALATSSATVNGRKEEDVNLIWGLTQVMAMLLFKGPLFTTKWNSLFRQIGYEVIVDRDLGFIHPNEPTQAVFLISKAFEQVDTIDNKFSSKHKDTRPRYLQKFDGLTNEIVFNSCGESPAIINTNLDCENKTIYIKTQDRLLLNKVNNSRILINVNYADLVIGKNQHIKQLHSGHHTGGTIVFGANCVIDDFNLGIYSCARLKFGKSSVVNKGRVFVENDVIIGSDCQLDCLMLFDTSKIKVGKNVRVKELVLSRIKDEAKEIPLIKKIKADKIVTNHKKSYELMQKAGIKNVEIGDEPY